MKRFRPSIESICAHAHCVESPSSVPCAHCPLTFCLRHLVEHQIAIDSEHKRLTTTIERSRARLTTIEPIDNREELCQQLEEWQTDMIERVSRMKNEIHAAYERYDQAFNRTRRAALEKLDDDEPKSLKEVRSTPNQRWYALCHGLDLYRVRAITPHARVFPTGPDPLSKQPGHAPD